MLIKQTLDRRIRLLMLRSGSLQLLLATVPGALQIRLRLVPNVPKRLGRFVIAVVTSRGCCGLVALVKSPTFFFTLSKISLANSFLFIAFQTLLLALRPRFVDRWIAVTTTAERDFKIRGVDSRSVRGS